MKTKIRARKKTIMRWITEKFGSLEMLANLAGVDTSIPQVRAFLKTVRTSRDPVILAIKWRAAVIEIHIEHHANGVDAANSFVGDLEKVAAATMLPSDTDDNDDLGEKDGDA